MKIIAKIAAIAVSAAMAACMFGCGSSDASQSSEPGFDVQDIEIHDPGFVITDEGTMRFGFLAVNPNDGYIAENVIFTVEAYDASGSMIAGGGETITALYPGTETPGAGETDLFSPNTATPQVASLSISAMMDSITWTATTVTSTDIEDSVDIVKPRLDANDAGDVEIMASIQLAQGDDVKLDASKPIEMRAVALMFDEDGNAICGTSPEAFTLDTDNTSYEFEALVANAPAFEECNLYVTPLSA